MIDLNELNKLMSEILEQLQICRESIDNVFDDSEFDLAYFDVKINFDVQIDNLRVGIQDEWKRLES